MAALLALTIVSIGALVIFYIIIYATTLQYNGEEDGLDVFYPEAEVYYIDDYRPKENPKAAS